MRCHSCGNDNKDELRPATTMMWEKHPTLVECKDPETCFQRVLDDIRREGEGRRER